MNRLFAALDIETDGLDVRYNKIMEVGIVREIPDGGLEEYEFSLPFKPTDQTSEVSLRINGYGEREFPQQIPFNQAVMILQNALSDRHIVGKNPQFDESFIRQLVYDFGGIPSWHHRLVDVGALTWGYDAGRKWIMDEPAWPQPPSFLKAREMVGIDADPTKLHGALYDARLTYDTFRRVIPRND